MKKLVQLFLLLISAIGFSQISLSRHNLTPLTDGQVVAFNTIAYPAAELDFYVKNNSTTASTNIKIACTALVNNDGTGFELCFGPDCLSSVEVGATYPVNLPYVTLAPGQSSGNEGHFLNTAIGSGTYPKDYSFRFYQAGNPGGNTIDITYRFDPNLSSDEINQLETSGVIIKSSLVDSQLELDVLKVTSMQIFDLNGKQVLSNKLEYGIHTIDVSSLASGVYLVNFINEKGTNSSKKIIKK
jgi:hypothetical protein